MKRRILSIITALALCLSLCPAWAFAAEGGSEPADLVLNVGELNGVQKIEINGNTVIMDGEEAQIFSTLVLTGTAENLWIGITSSGQVTLRDLNINIASNDIYNPLLELNNGSSVCVEGTVTLESSGPVIGGDNNSVLTGPGSLKITYSGTDTTVTAVRLTKGINIGGDLAISAPAGYSVEAAAGYVCPITAQNITLTHDQDSSNTLNLNAMDMLTINDQVIVAKVTPVDDTRPQFAYLTEAELDSAFAEGSSYANATFTLLADVERETALAIRINCILDLGGHTICCKKEECLVVYFGNTTTPFNVTIRGEGQVISTNNTALTVWGNVKLEGGTFTGNGEGYCGVYVNNEGAMLSIKDEKVIIRNTGGGYGLAIDSANSIKLRAGTYSGEKGAIKIFNSMTLGDLLEVLDGIRCVYFDENGAPITGKLEETTLTGTVTVGLCPHPYQYAHTDGDTTHSQTCPACGDEKDNEPCDFTDGLCACGAVLEVTLPAGLDLTYTGTEQTPDVAVTVDGIPLAEGYTVSYDNNINAGEDTAKVTVTGTAFSGTVEKAFTINMATLRAEGAGVAKGTHGLKLSELTVDGLIVYAESGAEVPGSWTVTGEAIPDVGDTGTYEAAFTPATGADNYNPLTAQVTLDISKAPALPSKPGTLEVRNNAAETYTYGLDALLPDVPEGLGSAVTYTLGTVSLGSYYTEGAKIEGQTLTLPIQAVESDEEIKIGTITVIIHTQNFEDMTATITVRSTNKVIPTDVTLNKTSMTLAVGSSERLTAIVVPSNATDKTVNWTSSNPAIAAVDANGNVTALRAGNATITAAAVDGGKTASCAVTVYTPAISVTGVTLNKTSMTLAVGNSERLTAIVAPSSATNKAVTWASSNPAIATVDNRGNVTAVSSGSATITVTTLDRGKTASCAVTVYTPAISVTGVTLNKTSTALTVGGSERLIAAVAPDDATNKAVTWATSDPAIATVDNSGNVTAVSSGSAVITVTTADGGRTAACAVTVEKITTTLALTATPVFLPAGGTVTLALTGLPAGGTATVTCSGGIHVTAGADGTWTATLPNSTATYTFTASYEGNASYQGAAATCTVTTKEAVILPAPPAGDNGEQFQLVMENGISEIPAGLQSIETLNTPEKLETAMRTEIIQATPDIPQANTAVYDVSLLVSTDGGATWTPATKDNFPSGGLAVTLPYPSGTNSSYRFTVVHMFTTSDFGKTPGDTEVFTPAQVKNTAQGLQVVVTGLSPISVGWTAPATTPDTPPTGNQGGGGWSSSSYAITVEKSEHGKVTSNRANASNGGTVTLTVTPDSGYVLDVLTVTDSHGNEIKLTAQGGGKYTFTMPSRAVTVRAAFAPLPDDTQKPCDGGADCPSRSFTDLEGVGTWYHEAVDYVLRNGLMGGYGRGTFGPNDHLSRAQFAQILFNKEGRPAANYLLQYSDVAEGAWHTAAIRWATSRGIIGGYGNGMFGPNDNITREQLAVMLWRYAGSPAATEKELHFTDADKASGYALEALRWAVENGIMSGKGGGILDPKGLATRVQTAQMLKDYLEGQSE